MNSTLDSVYIKNLKESQIHKDTTEINRSDAIIERFSVSGGNATPTFKIKKVFSITYLKL